MANNPTTLITGAAKGIGASIATRLAKSGHNIVLNYYSSEVEAAKTAKYCEGIGAKVLLVQGDVSKPSEAHRIVELAVKKFDGIDLLVNNAAFADFSNNPMQDVESNSLDSFDKIFHTNVLGALALSMQVVPHMKAASKGVIVNISSSAGITGVTNSSIIYAASKGALNTLTLSLAKSLAPTIRVNAICPAMVDSTWWEKRFPDENERFDFVESMKSKNPLNRVITPEEVANTVLFLYENESINGELIRIDCGGH